MLRWYPYTFIKLTTNNEKEPIWLAHNAGDETFTADISSRVSESLISSSL